MSTSGFGLAPMKEEGAAIPFDPACVSTVSGPATAWLEVSHTAAEFRELAEILRKGKTSLADSMAAACIEAAEFAGWEDRRAPK